MTEVTQDTLKRALENVQVPHTGGDSRDGARESVIDADMITGLSVEDDKVIALINVDPEHGSALEPLRQEVETALKKAAPGYQVSAILTAEREGGGDRPASGAADPARSPRSPGPPPGPPQDPHGMGKNPRLDNLPIRAIVAVASGKGGVGKSTVAANLAVALAEQGYKTGLMDADIYGPSVPKLFSLEGERPETINGQLIPPEAYGVKLMSMGMLVDPETPMIWRGPMVQTAVYQMLRDVKWADADMLDILIVDMPPGTGDAQLTMAQKVPMAGAVITSTPQDLALIDARKAVEMFKRVEVPILGLIENMSTFICPHCGEASEIFGHGGARSQADETEVPFLGAIPLTLELRQACDEGRPVAQDPDNVLAGFFADIARKLAGVILKS